MAQGNPYPGLRPFEQRDSRVFFGRDDQIDALLDRLERDRFLAVVGSSASGKSSLVRAGLLPALYGGHFTAAGSRWRVAVLRPGGAAIAALAGALESAGVLGNDASEAVRVGIARAVLEDGELGLIELVRDARLAAGENLLIVVDQFEELFRFRSDRGDAPAFVKLLLAAAAQRDIPIYVLITMRSDFLGDTAQFRDLPEAISNGLFLVPRLTREQLREAIDAPAAIAGGEIEPVLVNQLLNELGDSPDQLPVLQHALMRTWDIAHAGGAQDVPIGLSEFAATGGLAEALSIHGDIVYDALAPNLRAVAEKVFRALTDRTSDERGVRRPAKLAELCRVTGASREDVAAVVEAFRAPGISFVMPPASVPLDDATVIDISHESLMRVWIRLSEWVDDESRSARIYRRIADAAELHERGAGALLIDPALSLDLAWRSTQAPTAAWAERYVPDSYERTMRFLDRSSEQRDRDIAAAGVARRRRAFTATGFVVAFLFTLLSIGALLVLQHQRGEVLAAQSRNLARDAQSAIDRGDPVTGGLIALAALPQSLSHPDRPYTREALDALTRAYTELREKRDLTGHTAPIFRIAMSPDGRRVAAASEDGTARIWAVPSGELLHVIHGPGDLMSAINWSPDGRQLVATFKDGTAQSYDGTTYEKRVLFRKDSSYIFSGVFSRNGRYLLTASGDGQTRIWNAANGKVLHVLQGKGDTGMWCATFSPDGSKIATASADGYVRIWDARTAKQLHVFAYSGPAYWVDFAPDGRRVVAALSDYTVRVLDASSGKQLLVIHDGDITTYSATFSHDGRRIALGLRKKNAEVVDARTGKLLINLIGSDGHLWATAFSPDDRLLATGSGDGIARLWDLRERQPILTLVPPRPGENNVATYFGDGRRIAVAGDLDVARIWDAATGKVIRTLRGSGRGYRRAAVSTDGKLVATSGLSGIGIWEADSGRLLRHIVRGSLAREGPIAFMPDGRRILTGSSEDGFVRMWDWPSATLLKTFAENMNSVTALAVSHDGRSIAAGGFTSAVYVWDATSGRLRHKLELHDSVIQDLSFSLDDTRLLSSPDDGELDEWDTQTGNVLAILNAHTNVNTNAAAYSADRSRIVSAMDDGSMRVLDALDGDPLLILRADDTSLNSASFSPDGHNVVAASTDGIVRVWRLPTVPACQDLIDAMRAALPRPLRPDQLAEESISLDRASPLTNLFMGGETCSP